MDSFGIIQQYFTRLQCQFCSHTFLEGDVQLIRQDDAMFIVNVFCHRCQTQNGVTMVGLAGSEGMSNEEMLPVRVFKDPELTEAELARLAQFKPIVEDDVLAAHEFFGNLGSNWMSLIPEEMRQSQTGSGMESPDA